MKTSLVAGTLALTLGALVLAPAQSQAGKSEWATAGKILTGAVIVQVLRSTIDTDHREVRSERYERTYRPDYRREYRYESRSYRRTPRCAQVVPRCAEPPVRRERTEVIIYDRPESRRHRSHVYRRGGDRIFIHRR